MSESLSQSLSTTPIDLVAELSLSSGTTYIGQNLTLRSLYLVEGPMDAPTDTDRAFAFTPEKFFEITVDSSSTPIWAWLDFGEGKISLLEVD